MGRKGCENDEPYRGQGAAAEIGHIKLADEADLLVVERNPLESVDSLQDPLLIMSNGRIAVDRLSFGK